LSVGDLIFQIVDQVLFGSDLLGNFGDGLKLGCLFPQLGQLSRFVEDGGGSDLGCFPETFSATANSLAV